ncbi:TPA: twin-arginine translocation signal domain-containing protein [Candidatus Poribacteria bacterium]|nr:twin-arginine translocation signal domain-containing protein [Candidatus Poribacteria bacterium]
MKQKITRREFIKVSSAIGAGLALGNYSVLAEAKLSGSLKLRTLGRTKLGVTELSFGGAYLNSPAPLHLAIDRGVNLIHTAPNYTGSQSIEVVSDVMTTRRQEVFLALKEEPVSEEVGKALQQLNTDYVDILVPPFQSVDAISNPELEGAYETLKNEGKIRFSGFSCHYNMVVVMKKAIELGFFDVMLIRYNLNNSERLKPILAEAKRKQNMGFIAMKVVQPFKDTPEEIPEVIKNTIKNRNVDSLLIGMANLDEVNANVDVLSVGKP